MKNFLQSATLVLLILFVGCSSDPIQSHAPPAGLINLCLFDNGGVDESGKKFNRFKDTQACIEALEKFNES